jgi:amino acid permease
VPSFVFLNLIESVLSCFFFISISRSYFLHLNAYLKQHSSVSNEEFRSRCEAAQSVAHVRLALIIVSGAEQRERMQSALVFLSAVLALLSVNASPVQQTNKASCGVGYL